MRKIKVGSMVKLRVGRFEGKGKVVKIDGPVAQVACAEKRRTYRRRITTLLLGMMACLLLMPSLAFAQTTPVVDPGSDPMAFVNQILAAAHAHNFLLAVPLGALLVIWALRKFGAAVLKVAWFAGDQGGAVLSLLAAVAEATIAAAVLPGPHAIAATILWVAVTLFRNHALYALLKKATAGTRFASWFALLPVDLEDKPTDPAPVAKALIIFALGAGMLVSSPARAQVDYSIGPTLPLILVEPGTHPIQLAPGAGMQLTLTLDQLKKALGGKSWDLLDLQLMVFGSLLTNNAGDQMGAFSAAASLCTLSGTVCIGFGKHIIETQGGVLGGKDGYFGVLSFSFAIALAPMAPPVGVSAGAAGLPRANTLFLGQ